MISSKQTKKQKEQKTKKHKNQKHNNQRVARNKGIAKDYYRRVKSPNAVIYIMFSGKDIPYMYYSHIFSPSTYSTVIKL